MDYRKVLAALTKSWSDRSSSIFEHDSPAKGQCSPTAIVIQRMFGGSLVKTEVRGCWHFYNIIEGQIYDFTSSQFEAQIAYHNIASSEEDALTGCTKAQVAALMAAFLSAYHEDQDLPIQP